MCNEERLKEEQESNDNNNVVDQNGRHVVKMYDSFFINGTWGSQVCIEMELLGPSLLDLIRDTKYRGVPVSSVKRITKRMLQVRAAWYLFGRIRM